MKPTISYLVQSIVCIILVLMACACQPANDQMVKKQVSDKAIGDHLVIKLAHGEAEGDLLANPYWVYTEVFQQVLSEETNGRIKVEVFPNKQLGDYESLTYQASRGLIDIAAGVSPGNLSSYFPAIQVIELPYSFPTVGISRKVLDGPFGQNLSSAAAKESGVRILSYLPTGYRHFSNSKRPIRTPSDMIGLKIRVQPIPIHLAMVSSLGASPTPISWAELYSALQTGVVDGQENAPYTMLLAKLHEVQRYYTLDEHLLNTPLVIVNDDFFNSLTMQDRAVLETAARQATFAMLGVIRAKESQDMKTIAAAGVEIYKPSPEEMSLFVEVARVPTRDILKETIDPIWFDQLDAAIAAAAMKKIDEDL